MTRVFLLCWEMGILRKKRRSGSSCFVLIRGNAACIYESPHRAALKINYWTGMLFRWDCNPAVQLLTADYTCYRLASAVTMHYSSACVWTTVTIHYRSACVCACVPECVHRDRCREGYAIAYRQGLLQSAGIGILFPVHILPVHVWLCTVYDVKNVQN